MKLKLDNHGMRSMRIYLKCIAEYLLTEKHLEKQSIRIAEINTSLASLAQVEKKIMLKQFMGNPKNKFKSIGLRTHEAYALVRYENVYHHHTDADVYIKHILSTNFAELWKELLK